MISINNSLLNLKLQNTIFNNFQSFTTSLQRLITGLRINSPSDDPAGFYIASNFTTQIRGLEVVNQNIQSAMSILGIADESIEEINDIMGEIRDLVAKSTSDYLTPEEREANQKKINELFAQAKQIKENAEYNGNKLLSNTIKLDKNETYYNNKTSSGKSVATLGGISRTYTPVTTAAGQVLNKLADVTPTTSASPSSDNPSSDSEAQPDEVSSLADTTPTTQSIETPEPLMSASTMMFSAAPAMYSTLAAPTSSQDPADAGTMMMSLDEPDASTQSPNSGIMMMSLDAGDATAAPANASVSTTSSNVESWGTSGGTVSFAQDESKTVQIGDKIYTIENLKNSSSANSLTWSYNSGTGEITFIGSSFGITAANGQDDKIKLQSGSYNQINTGDGADSVNISYSYSQYNTVNTGEGNDSVSVSGNSNTIDTGNGDDYISITESINAVSSGAGNDTVFVSNANNYISTGEGDDSITVSRSDNQSQNIIETGLGINDKIIYESSYSSNIPTRTIIQSYESNETKTIAIGDKTYTIQNNGTKGNELTYFVSNNGLISFTGDNFTITAANNQSDNIIINGDNNNVDTADNNDTIVINGNSNNVNGGSGVDTYTDIGSNNTLSNVETQLTEVNWGSTEGTVSFNTNETKVVKISDKTYIITNISYSSNSLYWSYDSNTGNITFDGPSFTITAGNGQDDKLNVGGSGSFIFTGDGDDLVNNDFESYVIQINTGKGNDTVNTRGDDYLSWSVIYTGDGNDVINNSTDLSDYILAGGSGYNQYIGDITNNAVINYGPPPENWGTAGGTVSFGQDESKTVQIGDKIYTIENLKTTAGNNSLTWSYDNSTGEIIFSGSSFGITAADGQDDKIKLSSGSYNQINTGDGADSVNLSSSSSRYNTVNTGDGNDSVSVSGSYNTIDGGSGTNTYVNHSSSSSSNTITNFENAGTLSFTQNETKTIQIDGKTYTVQNLKNSSSANSLTWTYDNTTGEITFRGSAFGITAADGQDDRIKLNGGSYNTIDTGDGDDSVMLLSYSTQYNTVNTGEGNDSVHVSGNHNTVDTGAGNDSVHVSGNHNTVDTGAGNDTIRILDDYNTIDTGEGNDSVSVSGDSNTIDGGTGSNTYINNSIYSNTITNFENAGTLSFTQNETKTIQIDGKTYTVQNLKNSSSANSLTWTYDNTTGEITFWGSSFGITAADGQDDKIKLIDGSYNQINTGDGDDLVNIVFGSHDNTVNTGEGNDSVHVFGNYNTVDTGAGNDFVEVSGSDHNINTGDGDDSVYSSVGQENTINTGAGRDYLSLKATSENIINTGEGDDSVEVSSDSYSNTIDGGSGYNQYTDNGSNNTFINFDPPENWGTAGGTVSFGQDESKTVQIGDKIYTIENLKNNSTANSLTWSYNNSTGEITFRGSSFGITAADGQDDNIKLNSGNYNQINTGDGDDSVNVNSSYNTVNTGEGNDSVLVEGWYNTIDTGDGADSVNITDYASSSTINTGEGNDSVYIAGGTHGNTVNTGEGDDSVNITDYASSNTVNTGEGNDSVSVSGSFNTIDTGEGDDYVYVDGLHSSIRNTITTGKGNDSVNIINPNNTIKALIFNSNETRTLTINNKTYTILNNGSQGNELSYQTNGDKIHFFGDNFTITAADSQIDDISINGNYNNVNTSDNNDNVIINGNYNNVNGGAGTDSYVDLGTNNTITNFETQKQIENWGTAGGSVSFNEGEIKVVQIADKIYTIEKMKNHDSSSPELTWSYDNSTGEITFGGDSFRITAATGQEDNIILNGAFSQLFTGDNNDTVIIAGSSCGVDTGEGNDSVSVSRDHNTIDTGDGADSVSVSGDYNTVNTGEGDDSVNITDYAYSNTVNTGEGDDSVYIAGGTHGNTVNTGEGNDSVSVSGSFNTIDGGSGYNQYTDNGSNNTFINFEPPENWGTSGGTVSFGKDESKTVQIGDKIYTITNNGDANNTLSWSIGYNNRIEFGGDHFTITAADGQDDKLYIAGSHNEIYTGDGNDSIYSTTGERWNYIDAGDGDDSILFSGDHSTIETGNGNDYVDIFSSSNIVNTGEGNDTVSVNGSGNTVNTGLGSGDTITNLDKYNTVVQAFNTNETKTLTIDGKTYTIKNVGAQGNELSYELIDSASTGKTIFTGDDFIITAADGQDDNIGVNGNNNTINPGDGNDSVDIIGGSGNTINKGENTTVTDNGSGTIVTEPTPSIENWGTAGGTVSFGQDESKTVQIGDKIYTIENLKNNSTANSLTWSYNNSTGEITFSGSSFGITAADGQDDKIKLSGGSYNQINTGDGADSVNIYYSDDNTVNTGEGNDSVSVSGSSNTIDGGSGTNTYVNNASYNTPNTITNFENAGTFSFSQNETKTIQIDGKTYTVQNLSDSSSANSLTWTYDNTTGEITFWGSSFGITAADGQDDKIKLSGSSYNQINTGDGADSVNITDYASSNTVNTGEGNDSVEVDGDCNTIYTGDGADYFWSSAGSSYNTIDTGLGNDSVLIDGSYNQLNTGDGDDSIEFGQYGTLSDNTINSGLGTGDKVTNYKPNNTITQSYNTNETKTLTIGGKTYTVKNVGAQGNELSFIQDSSTGKITFTGDDFIITAADGQDDNIGVNGNNNTINPGDGNNTVDIIGGSGNTINKGENTTVTDNGSGTIVTEPTPSIENWGTAGGTVSFGQDESKTVQIGDKIYTIENLKTRTTTNSLTWSYNNSTGEITFSGSSFGITAADGQDDKIKLSSGNYNQINTGDGADSVNLASYSSQYNTVNTGEGNDSVSVSGYGNTIDGGSGTNTYVNNSTSSNTITNFENAGTLSFSRNETKTIQIDGKTYTVQNLKNSSSANSLTWTYNDSTGEITFWGSSFGITAADGQDDKIKLSSGSYNTIDTGDDDDSVDIWGNYNTVNTGEDNDSINISSGVHNNTINTGLGTSDKVTNYKPNNTITQSYNTNETKTLTIGGKTYTVKNVGAQGNELSYILDSSTGKITFTGDDFIITANNGQDDNIGVNGNNNTINPGDGNNTVDIDGEGNTFNPGSGNNDVTVDGDNNTVNKGDGNNDVTIGSGSGNTVDQGDNTTVDDNGSGTTVITPTSGTININEGQTTTVTIDGKKYDIEKLSGFSSTYGSDRVLNWSIKDGQITFEGNAFKITAHSGQEDNIIVDGAHNDVDTGNLDDNIEIINGSHNSISSASGDNSIIINTDYNTVYGGVDDDYIQIVDGSNNTIHGEAGNDSIIINSDYNQVYGGDGQDYINVSNGDYNKIYGQAGNDTIKIQGNQNTIDAGEGNDSTSIISGKDNTASGGTGYDKVYNKGSNTTYSQMDELVDANMNYSVFVDANLSSNSTFGFSTGIYFPDLDIDVSDRESAIDSLAQIDDIILGLTSSRVDIGFQKDMLDGILKTNQTRLTNLMNSRATLIDADTAAEYNNLLARAAMISNAQLLQTQLQQNYSSTILALINGIAG